MVKKIKSLLSSSNLKLPAQQSAILFSAIILVVSIMASLFLSDVMARQARDDYGVALNQKQNALSSRINSAIASYDQLLISGATLVNLKGDVTETEWEHFYNDMQVERQLPSTLGVGYVAVTGSENGQAVSGQKQTAIIYLEPKNAVNKKAIDFDMYAEATRREAMDKATDSASMAVSGPVTLVQDAETTAAQQNKNGILMYYPVYASQVLPMTIESRRNLLKGFVYVVVRPSDMLDGYANSSPDTFRGINAVLDDGVNSPMQLAAVNHLSESMSEAQTITTDFPVGNRTWSLKVTGKPNSVNTKLIPLCIVLLGSSFGIFLAAAMLRTLISRLETVQHSYEREVERTKDELLALASHQLRTPASGVKQYIGILTSGIAGPLTPTQQQIAERAYSTNERQIEIINQLLYVSKIEAGKVTIRPVKSDMTPIIQRAVDSLDSAAKLKNIKIVFRTKQPRYVYGDDQYYSMIIDNLISNAVKYSYPDTTVTISVKRRGDMLAMSVVDHGVGITDEDRASLFQKFKRIDNPLSRSEGGSGLGLFLAYQLARAHGGNILVSSTIGKGSTFTLLMPTKQQFSEVQVDIVRNTTNHFNAPN